MKPVYFIIFIAVTALLVAAQTPEHYMEPLDENGRWIHGGGSEPWSLTSEKYNAEQAKTFLRRWAALAQATDQTTNEWEGDYFLPGGETSVVQIRWASESGFALYYASTCMAAVTHLSYGGVYADAAEVMFLPEISILSPVKRDDYFLSVLRTKYVPVKWDGAHYLVSEADIKSFFNMFAGRGERTGALYFEKAEDEIEHHSMDDVVVPYGYTRYVKKPIEASITKVGKQKIGRVSEEYFSSDEDFELTPVVINAGSAKGVKVGIKFNNLSSEDDYAVVKRVFKDYSIGFIARPFCDGTETDEDAAPCENLKKNKISVGWKLTTFNKYPMY